MQITTTARVKLSKNDVIEIIDKRMEEKGIQRQSPVEFRANEKTLISANFEAIVKEPKKKGA